MNVSDITYLLIIVIIFMILQSFMFLTSNIEKIKKNWPLYRCNPSIMPFAGMFGHDSGENFSYCISSMNTSFMGDFLKPVNYNLNLMGSITDSVTSSLDDVRKSSNFMKSDSLDIIGKLMAMFQNILVGLQQMLIGFKDIMGKVMGSMMVFIYLLGGLAEYAMPSLKNSPFGVAVMGLCFHPDTLMKLNDGSLVKMRDIEIGQKLKNGSVVCATMKIKNFDEEGNIKEKLMAIPGGEDGKDIYVTGSHLIYNPEHEKFIQVKDNDNAKSTDVETRWFTCLITSDHLMPIGKHVFHDWEDNNGSPSKNLV